MAYPIPSRCSVCGGELMVTRLTCSNCQTELTGAFAPCKYCALNEKQRVFMETFLKCRGNIKEVERALSLSYPTVKGLLDELLATLFKQEPVSRPERMEVLDMLEKKLISVDEAARLLRGE
ncbi:MAG: DUF2089 domain-containing protein [Clostridiaceae bacterium]|nr:DUF2089 domain-containing protein [Eubacteriales bacterium]